MAVIKSGASTDLWSVDATSKAGRITLYDTAGHPIEVETVDGNYYLGTSIIQDVHASTANSSVVNINGSASWSGTGESTLGVAGIQVNTFINKQHTVTVYQSMDNSNWDIYDSWTVPASFGTSRTIQATASYYYVKVQNNIATEATVVRIQTALCPVVEALPRSLTAGGNLKVSIAAEWQAQNRTTGLYAISSFRTIGIASSPQNILTLENPAASTVALAIRNLNFTTDTTAALNSVSPQIKVSRPASLPSGGTALTAVKYKSEYSAHVAVVRGGTASDGGGATAITATAGDPLWSQFVDRLHTAVGWIAHNNYNLLPDVGADLRQVILLPGESILVQGVTSIPNTTHMVVNCSWSEFQYL
jgi:hypothetical protein